MYFPLPGWSAFITFRLMPVDPLLFKFAIPFPRLWLYNKVNRSVEGPVPAHDGFCRYGRRGDD